MSSGPIDGPTVGGDPTGTDEDVGVVETVYAYDELTGKAYVTSYIDWGSDTVDLGEGYTTRENLQKEIADHLSHGLDILSENAALDGPLLSEAAYKQASETIQRLMDGEHELG